jgi:acyl carrier protein
LTKNDPLDFFAIFSSLGAYGSRGSSDYSYSTAFQNAFSTQRNRWVREGSRSGATVSMCWGPWLEDHLFPASRAKLVETGFGLIDLESGFQNMATALAGGLSPLGLVKVRDGVKIRSLMGLAGGGSPAVEAKGEDGFDQLLAQWEQRRSRGEDVAGAVAERITMDQLNGMPDVLVQRVHQLLFGTNGKGDGNGNGNGDGDADSKGNGSGKANRDENAAALAAEVTPPAGAQIAEVAKVIRSALAELLQLTEIDDERSFMNYGLDSIAGMQLAVRLEKRLKREVTPQALLGYPTVAALSQHLLE